jgi:enterochelin esterase-like enzyme
MSQGTVIGGNARLECLMKRHQVALTAFLILPLALFVALCWAIAVTIREPHTPIGAGGGNTGGANAIGEWLKHGSTKGPQQQNEPAPLAALEQREPPRTPETPADPVMVEPESLPQGFLLVVEDRSGKANPASPIYLASNYINWNPSDGAYKLEPQSDMRWRINVIRPVGRTDRIEFKFTRGSWDLEELDPDLSPIANRRLPLIDAATVADGSIPRIDLVVHRWGDERPEFAARAAADPYRRIQATGDLRRLQVRGGPGSARDGVRDVLVWLPPGYDDAKNSGVSYPVLYMHDGQNVFEQLPGVPGEWRADETAQELVTRGQATAMIIVGVPHSGTGRISEYLPVPALEGVTPQGEEHIEWLLREVMPRVERAFRVKQGSENTAVGGSSLGAVISLYAAAKHPGTFGMVLAESLPLRTGAHQAWSQFLDSVDQWPRKVYLGVGGAETGTDAANAARNKAYVDAVRELDARLEKAGLGPDRRLLQVDAQATHTEEAWAKRLPLALRFLFPPDLDSTK